MKVSFRGNDNITTEKPRDLFEDIKTDLATKNHRPGYNYKIVDMPFDDVMADKRNFERGRNLWKYTNLTDRELKNVNVIGHMKNPRVMVQRGDLIPVEREIPVYKELIKIGFKKIVNGIKSHFKK